MTHDLPASGCAPAQSLPSRKLNILHVIPSYYPATRYGGPIRSVHALCAALVKHGHRVHVYTTNVDGQGVSEVPVGRPVVMDGVQVSYFGVPALRRLYWSPALAQRLKQTINEFDIVHLHSVFLWPTWAAARAAHAARIPYIVSPRGQLVRELIQRKSRLVKSAWISLIERRTLARASALHVTADLEGQDITALKLDLSRLLCVPNGVSWPDQHLAFDPGKFPQITGPYALYLGRINWKKGLDRLIRAWQWVPDLPLIIAGNDDEGYQKELEALARTVGVTSRVSFIGPVSDENKWAIYENAEMFVLPSYSENFGNVVAEAMAMGCPVLITPEVGLASLVRDSGAGLVIDGAPRAVADAVQSVLMDSVKRRNMSERGRAAARSLSWKSVAGDMQDAYYRICAERTSHPSGHP
jgi:glycosyltransferase involved in cell wall biosynthesis